LYWIGEKDRTLDQAVDERIVLKAMIKLSVFEATWIILTEDRDLVMRSFEHGNESPNRTKGGKLFLSERLQLFNKSPAPPIQAVHSSVTAQPCHSSGG
jgi:hypothetical protein